MKCMFTLLALVWAGSSMGADWQVTQSDSISAYVMCHQGDCPVRTAKVFDLPVAVPMPARVSDSAAKPVAVQLFYFSSFCVGIGSAQSDRESQAQGISRTAS